MRLLVLSVLAAALVSTGCAAPDLVSIDGKTPLPAVVDDPEIGRSMASPAVFSVRVSGEESPIYDGVGKLAHDVYFADAPPFVYKAYFSCGRAEGDRGAYGDPASIWWNVQLGCSEVDVPRATWRRPFGYSEDGDLRPEEIVRIGKADWNYFSNYLYGVPLEAVRAHDATDMSGVETFRAGRRRIGGRLWDAL